MVLGSSLLRNIAEESVEDFGDVLTYILLELGWKF
jgi:hypothetical protein